MAGKLFISSRGTPGGSDKQVQYNDGGLFGGAAQLYWDKANNRLGLGDSTPAKQLSITKCMEMLACTDAGIGVIYKGANRFIHDFQHPTGGGAVPVGRNVFLGTDAGNFTMGNGATETYHSSYNLGIGALALNAITLGDSNLGVGYGALALTTTGSSNAAIGRSALAANTSGGKNMALGRGALLRNTTGSENIAIGYNVLAHNLTNSGSIGIGKNVLTSSTGSKNTGIGNEALKSVTSGFYNTGIGLGALYNITTGERNIGIGVYAGQFLQAGGANQTATYSLYLGYSTRASIAGRTNENVFGYGAIGIGNNTFVLGNDSIVTTHIKGNTGIKTTTVNEALNVGGAIRLGTSALTNNGAIRWTGTDFEGYMTGWKSLTILKGLNEIFTTQGDLVLRGAANPERLAAGANNHVLTSNGAGTTPSWQAAAGGSPGGADTQVQFNDGGAFGGDSGLVYDKTKNQLTVGVAWGAGYPFNSFEGTIEGISEAGEWGVLGASRSSDSGVTGSMRCLGLYGFVENNSDNSAYALYTEARKTVSTPNCSTSGAEIVILNRYNSQVDVTQSSNPAQATYGLALTSGVTYDAVQDYDASVGLYFDEVGAKFRRGIVMSNSALKDLGGGKYVGIALPSSARIAWVDDDDCIMCNGTNLDSLIANTVIHRVKAAGVDVTGTLTATTKVKGGNAYLSGSLVSLNAAGTCNISEGTNMYFAVGGTTQAILYDTTGNFAIGGLFQENQWTLDIKGKNKKWQLLDSIMGAYKAHSGKKLDKMLKAEKNGRRPSDFIQVAVECIADLHKRIEVLENG
jgi:hypothetical protein